MCIRDRDNSDDSKTNGSDQPPRRDTLIICIPCGDGNLDGRVGPGSPSGVGQRSDDDDSHDKGLMESEDFRIWCDNRFSYGGGVMGGDYNCDGVTDVSDFNALNEIVHSSIGEVNPSIKVSQFQTPRITGGMGGSSK